MGHTFVAVPFAEELRRIEALLDIGEPERLCKIPFGRNCDREEANRRLPYHVTLVHWGKREDCLYLPRCEGFRTNGFKLKVAGLVWMYGEEGSELLVLRLLPCDGYDAMASRLEETLERPVSRFLHLTLAVSQDSNYLDRLMEHLEDAELPEVLHIERLELYHIWVPVERVQTIKLPVNKTNGNLICFRIRKH